MACGMETTKMTIRDLYQFSDVALANELEQLATKIATSPTTFGLTPTIATALSSMADTYSSAYTDYENARVSANSASFVKQTTRDEAVALFATYLNLMYASPTVTQEAITTLGFAPRSDQRKDIVPTIPQDLIATPFADGTVSFKWEPGENKYGVVYQLEVADADMTTWTVLLTTTKRSGTLAGFDPGTPRWFRVKATKGTRSSEYSFVAGIYIPMPSQAESSSQAA